MTRLFLAVKYWVGGMVWSDSWFYAGIICDGWQYPDDEKIINIGGDMKKYTLTITKKQAETIQEALEVFARLGIGQFRDALETLPKKEACPAGWSDDMLFIGQLLKKYMIGDVDGWQSSLSIHAGQVAPECQMAWDIHQVIRKKLSWDYAIEKGWVKDETEPRNWHKMMGVNFDDPMLVGPEPLAEIRGSDECLRDI